jgi:hypothetical protein
MRRWIAVLWHASFFVIAGALYFFFVLPRWFELTGAWPVGLGLAMRIVCGALLGLAALPVVLTLLKTRKPEFGTPQLALTLRFWSIVLHVLAGALIVGAAISEIWVTLDAAGQTLFGIYGAAAAVAILGALAFYLAYAAELPPPPPKPLRSKGQTRRRGRGSDGEDSEDVTADDGVTADEEVTADQEVAETAEADEPAADEAEDGPTPVTLEKATAEDTDDSDTPEATEASATDVTDSPSTGNADESGTDESDSKLRNRRPSGRSTSRLFSRSRRGVALDD